MGLKPTPTKSNRPQRGADFSSLAAALDYAASGQTGFNFYNGKGQLGAVLSYAELREQAQALARRFHGMGLERGARVALMAETDPDFPRLFFACQYAGMVPVPVPIPINLGSHETYIAQLRRLLLNCGAEIALAPDGFLGLLAQAARGLGLRFFGSPADFAELPEADVQLEPSTSSELAYLQYTSGSTRFPRGVMITQQAVMNNLQGIVQQGLKIVAGDRSMSWLPFYHDMGLVGLMLGPVASQVSVDYLGTRDFAMRPRRWLALMTQNRTTISFSPPFGFELCVRRLRADETDKFDLSAWRIAGVGAETIRPETLSRFARILAPSGFSDKAFLACYGMAECSLAISFASLNCGVDVDYVDADRLAACRQAVPVAADTPDKLRVAGFVDCGAPLPGYEVEVRDRQGRVLPERRFGTFFVRGPSVMSGYFGDHETSRETLSPDGWLNTGDVGYRIGERLVITGRQKDMIIINGRNIWPQDLEYLAEQQPELRSGDALAFAVAGPDGADMTVLVVQCRVTEEDKREGLVERLCQSIRREFGIECFIELVAPHTLPRTSSGKLSRSRARLEFLERYERERHDEPVFSAAASRLDARPS